MKIAMVHIDLPPESYAGVPVAVHRLCNGLARRGHQVDVFTTSRRPSDAKYTVVGIYLGDTSHSYARKKAFAEQIQSRSFSDYDLLHVHTAGCENRTAPLVVRTFYGSALSEAFSARSFLRFASQSLLWLSELKGALRADINVGISNACRRPVPLIRHIIPVGYTPGLKEPAPKSAFPLFVSIGSLTGRKNGNAVFDCFTQRILPECPGARLVFVGAGTATRSHPSVDFLANISETEKEHVLGSAWAYLSASSYEGFGIPYLESMACGTAVLALRNGGARELLCDAPFSLCRSVSEIGTKALQLVSRPDMRMKLEETGKRIAGRYTVEKMIAAYETLYTHALKNRTQIRT